MNEQAMMVLLGQIRTILAAIGGVMVARGLVSDDLVNSIIGAIVIIVPAVWSAWEKIKQTTPVVQDATPAIVVPSVKHDAKAKP